MASRKTEVRGLVGRPILTPEHALFLRLRWGGWNFLVGLLGLVLPQIPAKITACCYKRAIVELIVKPGRYLLKHSQMLPVYAHVV